MFDKTEEIHFLLFCFLEKSIGSALSKIDQTKKYRRQKDNYNAELVTQEK